MWREFMKNKLLSIFLFMNTIPIAAMAAGDYSDFDDRVPLSERLLREYKTESPNLVFRDRKQSERIEKFYAGLRADLSFLTWKNKNSGTDENGYPISGEDKFNFKPVIGLDLSVGYRFDDRWRADVEIGYVGKYSETEVDYYSYSPTEKTEFNLESYYININAYYDLIYGLYAGLGAGVSIVNVSVDNSNYDKVSVSNVSPMGALMFGWVYMLDEKIDLDIRYRFSLFNGGDIKVGGAKADLGTIIGNAISVGVRYHF